MGGKSNIYGAISKSEPIFVILNRDIYQISLGRLIFAAYTLITKMFTQTLKNQIRK